MIEWTYENEAFREGVFNSIIFLNENDDSKLNICMFAGTDDEYAQRCIKSFNSLPEITIMQICKGIIKCAEKCVSNILFELPQSENAKDILKYCWFHTLLDVEPERRAGKTAYVVEGEGEWGEAVCFVIENDTAVYIGADYLEYFEG